MASRETGSDSLKIKRASGTIALLALLALGICASTASADPLSMTFTEGRANVGVQLSVTNDEDALFKAPDRAPFAAQIDPGSGSITAGVLGVPEFVTHITDPIDAVVSVEFEIGTITGSFDQATGALTLSGKAGGTLTSDGRECDVSTDPSILELSTSENTGGVSPLFGAPFTTGLAGAGAIAGEWTDMHTTSLSGPGDINFCEDVEGEIGGQGGIWLEQEDIVAPSVPQFSSTDPASPNPSGTPRIRGAAEAGSTVRVYAGPNCAGTPVATASAAELGSPGIRVEVGEGVTAAFSATATDAAGNSSACSAPISYTRQKILPPPPACVVPKLAGKKLARAKAALKAAHCAVGKVTRPKARKGRRLGHLVVKSSKPSAGNILEDGSKVDLTLGPKPRKAHPY